MIEQSFKIQYRTEWNGVFWGWQDCNILWKGFKTYDSAMKHLTGLGISNMTFPFSENVTWHYRIVKEE